MVRFKFLYDNFIIGRRDENISGSSMIPIQVRLTKRLLEKIDKAVEQGLYSCRSHLIRDAIRKHVNGFENIEKEENSV